MPDFGSQLATAFVRIRPDLTGFRAQTETGVKSAFLGVGKIVGTALGGFGAFQLGKGIIQAAAEHQAAFAVVERTVKNARAENELYGQSIQSLISHEARLKGFSDEELATSFNRLVIGTHNTGKAFRDLGLAEDLARANHQDLLVTALGLSRAEQGATQSLSRFGIVVQKVSPNVTALKIEHDKATAAGVKFSGQLKISYQAALTTAKAQDKLANELNVVAAVQRRVGGASATFARTSSGQFQRLGVDVHQLKVVIGTDVLPPLTTAAERVGHFTQELSRSKNVQDAVKGGLHEIGTGLHEIKVGAAEVGPPLLSVARFAERVVGAVGAGPILAAAVAYKGFAIAAATTVRVLATYEKIVAAAKAVTLAYAGAQAVQTASTAANTTATRGSLGLKAVFTGAQRAEAGSTTALTAALEANTVALTENAVASRVATGANALLNTSMGAMMAARAAVELEALSGAEVAAGAAATTSAVEVGGLGAAIGALPFGVVALGIAALAGGIFFLATRSDSATAAVKRLKDALGAEADAVNASADAQDSLKRSQLDVVTGRTTVAQAKLSVEQAKGRLTALAGKKGSLEYKQALLDLRSATENERSSELGLKEALRASTKAAKDAKDKTNDLAAAREKLFEQTHKLAKQGEPDPRFGPRGSKPAIQTPPAFTNAAAQQKQASDFSKQLRDAADNQKNIEPAMRRNLRLLADFTDALHHVPAQRQIDLVLNNKKIQPGFDALKAVLGRLPTKAETKLILDAPNRSDALDAFTAALHRLPTKHETRMVIDSKGAKLGLAELLRLTNETLAQAKIEAAGGGSNVGIAFSRGLATVPAPKITPALRFADSLRAEAENARNLPAAVRTALTAIANLTEAIGKKPTKKQISLIVDATHVAPAIAAFRNALGRIPTQHETRLLLNAPNRDAAVGALQAALGRVPTQKEIDLVVRARDEGTATLKAALGRVPTQREISLILRAPNRDAAIAALKDALGKVPTQHQTDLIVSTRSATVEALRATLGKIPTQKQISLIVNSPNRDAAVNALRQALGRVPTQREVRLIVDGSHAGPVVTTFQQAVERLPTVHETSLLLRAPNREAVVAALKSALGRVPTKHETDLLLKLPDESAISRLRALLDRLPARRATQLLISVTGAAAIPSLRAEIERLPAKRAISLLFDDSAVGPALGALRAALGRVPTEKDISLIVRAPNRDAAINALRQELGRVPTKREVRLIVDGSRAKGGLAAFAGLLAGAIQDAQKRALSGGQQTGQNFGLGMAAGIASEAGSVFSATDLLLQGITARTKKNAPAPDIVPPAKLNEARKNSTAASAALKKLQQEYAATVASGAQSIRDAQQNLADTITQGAQAVLDSVNQAKQSLNTIGQSLVGEINQFLTAQSQNINKNLAGTPLGKQAKSLRNLIASGASSDEIRRKAQEVSNQLDARQVAAQNEAQLKSQKLQQRFADLTDLFNKGAITLRQFNHRVDLLLRQEGISPSSARKTLGVAFADQFTADLKGLFEQAKAEAGFRTGKFAGTGLEPTIVRPINVLKDAIKQDNRAAQQLRHQQLAEQKKQTKELQKLNNAKATEKTTRAILKALQAKKPRSEAGKKAHDAALLGPH